MKEGWEEKKLGDVCAVIAGQSPESKYYNTEGEGLPFYQGKKEFTEKYLGLPTIWTSKVTKEAQKDDVLMSVRAPVGPVNFATQQICIGRGLAAIRATEKINKNYLFYFFLKNESEIECSNGAVFNSINKSQISKIKIPIPPLSEQKEIVAKLDEAFAAIDVAKANIEKNLENARELFQSRLNEIFSRKGEGWEEKRLGDLSYVKSGGTPLRSKKEYWNDGNIPWYSSGELNHLYTTTPNRFITKTGLENSNAQLFQKGSLLIGMYDTAALKMSIADRDASFNQAVAGVEPIDNLNLKFVLNSINSVKPSLLKQRRGVRQKNLSLQKIKDIKIGIPSIEIQNNLVDNLETLQKEIDIIVLNYQQKLTNLEELKKSLLQKAFAGELT